MKNIFYLLIIWPLFAQVTCQPKEAFKCPSGYDFSKPEVENLPSDLKEISGIAFKNGHKDSLFAIQDEAGHVFFKPFDNNNAIKFGKKGDYEDLTISNNHMIILRSDGALFSYSLSMTANLSTLNVQETISILPKEEYEGLYSGGTDTLYVLCKECKFDKKEEKTTGYILKIDKTGHMSFLKNFTINTKEIEKKIGKKKLNFRPSALAKNIWTNEWYVLSSSNSLLVITDENWSAKEVFKLDGELFAQPEGIAFDKDHNLYISNESGKGKPANILKFAFSQK